MRKSFWLAAASVVLLPVISQAAITFRVDPQSVTPGQTGFFNVIAEATGTDVGRGFDGFVTTASLTGAGTNATFSGPASDTTTVPQYQPGNGFPTETTLTSVQYQASALAPVPFGTAGAAEPVVLGLMRVPFTVSPLAQPGSTFAIALPNGSDQNALLLIVNGALTSVTPTTLTGAAFTVVPEPASLGLLALGGLFGLRRRRAA